MYAELAAKYDLELVKGSIQDMVSENLMQADGIHPNIKGHELVEMEVRNKLLPLLD